VKNDDSDVTPYLERLRSLPFVRLASYRAGKPEVGPVLTLKAPEMEQTFAVAHLRSQLSRNEAELWAGRARAPKQTKRLVIMTPYVSGPLSSRLRESGIYYVDGCGNLFLEMAGKHGTQHVALFGGNVPGRQRPAERAWRAQSYQVLFTLLAEPKLLSASVRQVANEAEVSTTPVLQVRDKLVQLGFAGETKAGLVWTPGGTTRAREFWLRGYQSTLRPNLLIQRYRPRKELSVADLEGDIDLRLGKRFIWRWGGAAAAYRLDRYYRGNLTVVHIHSPKVDKAAVASALQMLPDPGGQVVVLRSPGIHAFALGRAQSILPLLPKTEARDALVHTTQPWTVHPLLVWAELLEEGNDRASEAATELAARFLDGDADA